MPYNHFKRDDKECVYKVDADGNPEGETLGCHDTVKEAVAQIAAITISESEDVIKHYGVKGMRWGVRRKRTASGDYESVSKLRKKHTKELSNEELKRINNRLNLEKQYKALDPAVTTRGKRYAGKILGGAASTVLATAVVGAATKYGKQVLDYALKGG